MKAVIVLLATVLFAPAAAAQETVALAIEGWRSETRQDGVVYYRCASRICATGSAVSYKRQPHRPTVTLAEFESHHRGLAERYKGTERMRDVRIANAPQRTISGVRVLQVSREVDWASGNTVFSIEARLIGKDKSFSLVSDSPKAEWTANNFEGFLRPLVDIAGSTSATRIPGRCTTRGALSGDRAMRATTSRIRLSIAAATRGSSTSR